MIKAVTFPVGLLLVLATVEPLYSQLTPEQVAVNEVIRREADRFNLRDKLAAAQAAEARRDLTRAGTLYDDAWVLVQSIGTGVETERQQTREGLARVRLEMARAAQKRGNLREADKMIQDLLRVDPANELALDFRDLNNKLLREQAGKLPSEAVEAQVPVIVEQKLKTSTAVQNGRLFYEMGKLDEAEAALKQAIKEDPENQAAYYYMNLVRESRFNQALRIRDVTSRERLVDIEQAWANPPRRELLPSPNLYARTNLINTSRGRPMILTKLDRIRLDKGWDGLPLSEVIKDLTDESKKRDPEKRGINFIINPNTEGAGAP